jgi:ferredoxin-NADP reductase
VESKGVAEASALTKVRLTAIQYAALEIHLFRFQSLSGMPLLPAEAGAHIDVHLPNGLNRQYSLVLNGNDTASYTVAVKLEPASRGGSRYLHKELRVGDILEVSAPRNHFPLDETAGHSVLIAGGIGITPVFSMLHRLRAIGKSVELHYAARSRADMAFLDVLGAIPRTHLHFDDESGGAHLDLEAIVGQAPSDSHFYGCGPLPLLQAFEKAVAHLPASRRHVEYFAPREAGSRTGGFSVRLARSGRTLAVKEGASILDTLLDAGVDVLYSCAQGVCGLCEVPVVSGIPDHRDSILSPEEHASNQRMMICCSGSKSAELVLDL